MSTDWNAPDLQADTLIDRIFERGGTRGCSMSAREEPDLTASSSHLNEQP
jgi:hypothetical protein